MSADRAAHHRRMRTASVLALLASAALVAGGCGGSSESSSEDDNKPQATTTTPTAADQVRVAADRMFQTEDAAALCGQLVTAHYIDDVFQGNEQRCVKAQRQSLTEDDDDGTTKVTGVEITGPRATVAVEVVDGQAAGVAGHVTFAQESNAWKLDGYGDDYLRNALVKSMQVAGQAEGTGMFTEPSLRNCIIKDTKAMSADALRAYMYSFIRQDRANAMKVANKQAAGCPDELVTYVTNAIVDALNQDGKRSPAFVACARRELKFLLDISGLAKNGLKGNVNDAVRAAYEGLAKGVNQTCTKEEKASPQ